MPSQTPRSLNHPLVRRKLICAAVRVALFCRRWKISDLAKAIGRNYVTTSLVICGTNRTAATRRAIEACLRVPLWSPPGEYAKRAPMIEFFQGYDLEAMTIRELIALIDKRGLPLRRRTNLPRSFYLNLLREEFRRATATTTSPDADEKK